MALPQDRRDKIDGNLIIEIRFNLSLWKYHHGQSFFPGEDTNKSINFNSGTLREFWVGKTHFGGACGPSGLGDSDQGSSIIPQTEGSPWFSHRVRHIISRVRTILEWVP